MRARASSPRPAGRLAARGFSLVELLVSMVIGVVVIGALLAAYLAVSQSRTHVDAMAQMSDDAGAALQVLRQHVAMAGYRAPTRLADGLAPLKPALAGCNGGTGWAAGSQAAIDALGPCAGAGAGAGSGPDWLAVSYQVDVPADGTRPASNGVLAADRAPYDCAGNAIAAVDGQYLLDAHFYVARSSVTGRPALYCRQGGTTASVAGQVLSENVADFQVQYLMAPTAAPGGSSAPRPPAWFTDLPDTQAVAGSRFDDVLALRLCVEVTSATPVADRRQPQTFLDCANVSRVATDGYLHRAFTTSVTLQNRS